MSLYRYNKQSGLDQLLSSLGRGIHGYAQGKSGYDDRQQQQLLQQKQAEMQEQTLALQQAKFQQSQQPTPVSPQDIGSLISSLQSGVGAGTVNPQIANSLYDAMARQAGLPQTMGPRVAFTKPPEKKEKAERFFNVNKKTFSDDPNVLQEGQGWVPWSSGLSKFFESQADSERYSKPVVSDGSIGLPKGTLYQEGPSGGIKIIYEPKPNESEDWRPAGTVLRKEFNAAKVAADFQTIQRSGRQIEAAYVEATKPMTDKKSRVASDQALAVSFQKMLDPSSVVRESEYARTPAGIALMNKIEAFLPQLEQGGLMVTDVDRKAILDMSMKLLSEAQRSMNEHIDRYENLAKTYNVPPEAIFGGIKRFDMGDKGQESKAVTPDLLKKWGLTE